MLINNIIVDKFNRNEECVWPDYTIVSIKSDILRLYYKEEDKGTTFPQLTDTWKIRHETLAIKKWMHKTKVYYYFYLFFFYIQLNRFFVEKKKKN